MFLPHCEQEEAVRKAAALNRMTESLLRHADNCEVCSEVLLVSRMLCEQADEILAAADQASPLPDAGLVWWKAQVRAHRQSARAAVRPIRIVQTISWALALAAATTLSAWAWPYLQSWSKVFRFAWSQWTSLGAIATPIYLLAGGAVLMLGLVCFGVYAAWAEE